MAAFSTSFNFRLYTWLSLPSMSDMTAIFHAAHFAALHSSARRVVFFVKRNRIRDSSACNTTHQCCVDTALWDWRARKQAMPLWVLLGGAQARVPLYTTEGGWLQLSPSELVEQSLAAQADGFRGAKIKIGRPHVSEDVARLQAVREAVGPGFDIMTDANQGFARHEALRRAAAFDGLDLAWIEEPFPAEAPGI